MKKSIPLLILLKSLGLTGKKIASSTLKNKNSHLNTFTDDGLNIKESLKTLSEILSDQNINFV